MPNLIKYSTTNVANSLRKGNVAIGMNSVDYGPTSSTGFWNGIFPPQAGFVVVTVPSDSTTPSFRVFTDNNAFISYVQTTLGGTGVTTVIGALQYIATLSNTICLRNVFTSLVTSGLVLSLNPYSFASYPGAGTTVYDISGGGNNSTLQNGVGFNDTTGGSLIFDGTDDFSSFFAPNLSTVATVEMVCKITSGYSEKMFMGWQSYDIWCSGGALGYNTGNGDVYGFSSAQVSSLGLVNIWKHYIFEMRSDVSYTNNKIYINGVSQTLSQIQSSENPASRNFSSGNGRIASWGNGGYNMPMNLVLFRVYNKSLSQDEVNQNFYQGDIITSNLSHLWDASNIVSFDPTNLISETLSTVIDIKSGVNATSLTNVPSFNNQNGGFWTFDGSNNYLLLNNGNYSITLGNGNTDWTVNIWMKTTTSSNGLASNGDLLSNTNGGPIYSVFSVNAGKQTYWAYPSDINNWKQLQGTITVNDDVWHMLTWVNNSNYTMDLYVDGVYNTTVGPVNVANNNPLDIIGGGLGFISFDGSIGSVQINKGTAFSRTQVLQQYNATFKRFK